MDNPNEEKENNRPSTEIFEDYESSQNIIGLYNLLLQIDKRVNPALYQDNKKHNV